MDGCCEGLFFFSIWASFHECGKGDHFSSEGPVAFPAPDFYIVTPFPQNLLYPPFYTQRHFFWNVSTKGGGSHHCYSLPLGEATGILGTQ